MLSKFVGTCRKFKRFSKLEICMSFINKKQIQWGLQYRTSFIGITNNLVSYTACLLCRCSLLLPFCPVFETCPVYETPITWFPLPCVSYTGNRPCFYTGQNGHYWSLRYTRQNCLVYRPTASADIHTRFTC